MNILLESNQNGPTSGTATRLRSIFACLTYLSMLSSIVGASTEGGLSLQRVQFSSGQQFRMDSNTDVIDGAGNRLGDTTPFRVRLTPQVEFEASEAGGFVMRARAEYRHNESSDKSEIFFDKWLYRFNGSDVDFRLGRGDLPFWSQNDLFWDGDVTPAGVFASKTINSESITTALSGGYFHLPYGKDEFEDTMAAAQAHVLGEYGTVNWSAAGSIFQINTDDGSGAFAGFDRERDYTILSLSFSAEIEAQEKPLGAGIDFYKNTESYGVTDLLANSGEDTGYVFTAFWGEQAKRNDLKVGYTYAHIEALSVNTPYSQGDWLRFSSGGHPSGMKGHGFWATYSVTDKQSITGYIFLRDSLDSKQEENRFRFEYNTSF